MNKYFLYAASVLALASCSSDASWVRTQETDKMHYLQLISVVMQVR